MKYISNMKQGEKEIKSTKVPKSLFNKKKDKLNNLIKQIDDGDEESSSENKDYQIKNLDNKALKNDIDYGMLDDYTPNYVQSQSKKKNENINIEPLEENIDIEKEEKDLPIKQKAIKREKKVLADDSKGRKS